MSSKRGQRQDKHSLVANIVANARSMSTKLDLSSPESEEWQMQSPPSRFDDHSSRSDYKKKHKSTTSKTPKPSKKSKSPSTDFDISSLRYHLASPKAKKKRRSQSTTISDKNKTRRSSLHRKSKASHHNSSSRSIPDDDDDTLSLVKLSKRNTSNARASKPVSSNPSNARRSHSYKQQKPAVSARSAVSTQMFDTNLSAPSLQSIHSDGEEDEFNDILSPKILPPHSTSQRKHAASTSRPKRNSKSKAKHSKQTQVQTEKQKRLQSMLHAIVTENEHDTQPEHITIHLEHSNASSFDGSKKPFKLCIDEETQSFSMNLQSSWTIASFVDFHIGFDDDRKRAAHKMQMSFDVNSYSLFDAHSVEHDEHDDDRKEQKENEPHKQNKIKLHSKTNEVGSHSAEFQSIYEQYVQQHGKPPKQAKLLMSFAAAKQGVTIRYGDARRVILKNRHSEIRINIDNMYTPKSEPDTAGDSESAVQEKQDVYPRKRRKSIEETSNRQQSTTPPQPAEVTTSNMDITADERETQQTASSNVKSLKAALSSILPSDDEDVDDDGEYIRNAEEAEPERDTERGRKQQQLKAALSGILMSDEEWEEEEAAETETANISLSLSQTVVSPSPEAVTVSENDEDAIINEDTEMVYNTQDTLNKLPRSTGTTPSPYSCSEYHERSTSDIDILRAMLNDLDTNDESSSSDTESCSSTLSQKSKKSTVSNRYDEDEDDILRRLKKKRRDSSSSNASENAATYKPVINIQNDDAYNKRRQKRYAKKKSRSQSQPSDAIQDVMYDVHSSQYLSSPKVTRSKPNTPSKVGHSPSSLNYHQRSMSTDVARKRPAKLQEWQKKYKNGSDAQYKSRSNSMDKNGFVSLQNKSKVVRSKTKSKRNVHPLDFNLFGIDIQRYRRYRLIDGRIGIAKYKGPTAFGKGIETYVGILVEHGVGVHDGSVRGRSYFRCKDGKGDMVHPFEVIEDLGSYEKPLTQEMVEGGDEIVEEAQRRLMQYQTKHKLKSIRK